MKTLNKGAKRIRLLKAVFEVAVRIQLRFFK
jgi:hypothetical protein